MSTYDVTIESNSSSGGTWNLPVTADRIEISDFGVLKFFNRSSVDPVRGFAPGYWLAVAKK